MWKTEKAPGNVYIQTELRVLLACKCKYKGSFHLSARIYQKNILQDKKKKKKNTEHGRSSQIHSVQFFKPSESLKHQDVWNKREEKMVILSFLYALHFFFKVYKITVKARFKALRLLIYRQNRDIKLRHYHSHYYTQHFLFPSLGWAISMALLPCQEHLWT